MFFFYFSGKFAKQDGKKIHDFFSKVCHSVSVLGAMLTTPQQRCPVMNEMGGGGGREGSIVTLCMLTETL